MKSNIDTGTNIRIWTFFVSLLMIGTAIVPLISTSTGALSTGNTSIPEVINLENGVFVIYGDFYDEEGMPVSPVTLTILMPCSRSILKHHIMRLT